MINEQNIEVLFHVDLVSANLSDNDNGGYEISFFGREGNISLHTEKFYNFAAKADHCFTTFDEPVTDLFIITFFADSLPRHIPEFDVVSRIETDIGEYLSINPDYSQRNLFMNKDKLEIMRKSSRTAVGTMRKWFLSLTPCMDKFRSSFLPPKFELCSNMI